MNRIVLLLLILTSCSTKREVREDVFLGQYERQLFIQKDSLDLGWQFNGRLEANILPEMKPGQVVIIKDTTQAGELRGQIRVMMDEFGNLQIHCEEQSKLISKLRTALLEREQELHQFREEQKTREPWFSQQMLTAFLVGLCSGLILITIIRLRHA